jgi:hypothetical protein
MDLENAGRRLPNNTTLNCFLIEISPYDLLINTADVTTKIRVSSTRALTTDAIVAISDLISKQYFVLPTCIPVTPIGTMMKQAKTDNHEAVKNATRYLLLLQRAQTRITKSRAVRGVVSGYNILMSRMYLQLPIGAAIEKKEVSIMSLRRAQKVN